MTQMSSKSTNNGHLEFETAALPAADRSLFDTDSVANDSFQLQVGEMLEEPRMVYAPEAGMVGEQAGGRSMMSSMASSPLHDSASKAASQADKGWRQGRWKNFGLQKKATLVAAAIGVIPALLVGLGSYSIASQALLEKSQQTLELTANGVVEQLALFMRERYGDIQIIAGAELFTDAAKRASSTPQQKQALLDQFTKAYPIYDSIAFFDLNGNVLGQSSGKTLGNHSDRLYFQQALKEGKAILFADPIPSKTTGEVSVYGASPVRDQASGQIVGIVRVRVPVKALNSFVQEITKTNVGTGGELEFHMYNADNQLFLDSEAVGGEDVAHDQADAILQQFSGSPTKVTRLVEDVMASYIPWTRFEDSFRKDLPNLGWQALVLIDRDVALASQRQLLLLTLGGTAIAAGLLGAIAAWLANRTTKPLIAAVDAVQAIGDGNLDIRLPVRGQDELAQLASNLNTMAEQLGDFTQEQSLSAKRATWLNNIAANAQTLNANEDLGARFQQVLWEAMELLAVDRIVIYQFRADGSGFIAQEAVNPGWPVAMNLSINDACIPAELMSAYREGRVVPTTDVYNAGFHPDHVALMEQLQIRSNLVVPMVDNGQLFGLLVAHHCQTTHEWQAAEISFMTQLAAQLAIAKVLQEVDTARASAERFGQEQKQQKEDLQRRVLELLMEVDPLSRGDLTIRAKVTEDEIGTVADSYNATIESLRKIVTQVQQAAVQMAQTVTQNESTVDALASGATQQTEEISEALQQVQQMADSIRMVAQNAAQAEAAVQQATQTVQAGDAAMNRTVEGIFTIRETVGEAAKKVKRLGESSQKISKVVNLIGSFAEQTNLLALNASIEAAHAGEEGRGFAVVADEVRSLARQSAAATAEIEALVAEIQSETNQVSAAMESGTEQVVVGTQLVEAARQNLNQITAVSAQINDLVAAIASATTQQSQASETVSTVMTDVAAIATKTASSMDSVSSSFQDLVNLAQSLQSTVGRFKVS